jgi:hypothetical protein
LSFFTSCCNLNSRPFLKELIAESNFNEKAHSCLNRFFARFQSMLVDLNQTELDQPRKKAKFKKTKLDEAHERLEMVMKKAKQTLGST